jgi:hypothetical protein
LKRVWGGVFAVLGLAALGGGMLFFGAVMAPLVFLHLPPDVAGPFIRTAFPWYYGYCIGSAAVVAVGFMLRREWLSVLLALAIIGVTGWLWQDLLPSLDVMRTAHDAAGFARGHRLAVGVNAAVLLAVTTLLMRVGAWLK